MPVQNDFNFRGGSGRGTRRPKAAGSPARAKRGASTAPEGAKPAPWVEPTTLWDYPSQNYPGRRSDRQGDEKYPGVTPAFVIWNLIQRYTVEGETVVDPFCGSGTTLDVAEDTGRRGVGFDLAPTRPQIARADARDLPLPDASADLVFMDPPYSDHIDYSDDPACIGKLPAGGDDYHSAMEQVFTEASRVLKPGRHLGVYVCDSYVHKGRHAGFHPIGFELFARLRRLFEPVDIVAVVRHNKTLEMGNYRRAAEEGNFFLRGFNYLFILRKAAAPPRPKKKPPPRKAGKAKPWFKYRRPRD